MGCCSFIGIEPTSQDQLRKGEMEISPNISFADMSIGSRHNFDAAVEVMNTDELNFTKSQRLRSTSCNSLRYSTHIESAFLMTTPIAGTSIVSSSCNLKSNETLMENSMSFINLQTYQ